MHAPSSKRSSIPRRAFMRKAAAGTTVAALGALWIFDDALTRTAKAQTRADGRPRLPPGQKVISKLRPMGGTPGDPSRARFRLRVHGEVASPRVLDFPALRALGETVRPADVHCVTGWSVLGARWRGVPIAAVAELCRPTRHARHVIFEAAGGYTANVRIDEALADGTMIVWELDGRPLPGRHGGPVRALVPDLYFWKSAKWLTGIRFVRRDEPGYWERRGYHNHADPWREERYA
ncbi:MAG: molybdopterin-binding oxidoreductase [Deltaproteobacteria bacterium]|nr:MAG: molybdopterin-binding oxidoreductase [Deltaproteobacteria bacterium]